MKAIDTLIGVEPGFKRCVKCGVVKAFECFPKQKAMKDGHSSWCKMCKRVYDQELKSTEAYKAANRERVKSRYANDPAFRNRHLHSSAVQRKNNPEKKKADNRKYRLTHTESLRAYIKEYRKTYVPPGGKQQYSREMRTRHRVSRQVSSAKYYAIRVNAPGEITNQQLFFLHNWQDHCCYYCGTPLQQKETIEHIIPLSRGGTNDNDNASLVCTKCNFSKKNNLFFEEWLSSRLITPQRFYSIYATRLLSKSIKELGIPHSVNAGIIQVAGEALMILSSFWLASRTPQVSSHAPVGVAVVWDFEVFKNTDRVAQQLLSGVISPTPARCCNSVGIYKEVPATRFHHIACGYLLLPQI